MGDAGFFKGTSADQDSRFSNKEKKLLKSMNFPPEFDEKVDMKKVKLDVIKPWITTRITNLLGFEDEVVIDFAFGLLEEKDPDPKMMQINLTGFLEKSTQGFILELWRLLLSAQASVSGIPKQFLEEKKKEILRTQEHQADLKARQEAVMDAIRRRKEAEEEDMKKEREHRHRPSRFDVRRSSRSRSPRRRYRSRSPPRRHYRSSRRDSRSPRRHRRPSVSPPRRRRHRSRSPRARSPDYRRRRSPSTPRRRRRSVTPTSRSRSPSPKRSRRDSPRQASPSRSPPSKPERSKWDDDEDTEGNPASKTAHLREQALASMKKRRDTKSD